MQYYLPISFVLSYLETDKLQQKVSLLLVVNLITQYMLEVLLPQGILHKHIFLQTVFKFLNTFFLLSDEPIP